MGINLFKHEMCRAGLSTKAVIVPDGKLHRFYVEGDTQGSLNGWYVFYMDGLTAGAFGSWKTGNKCIWCIKADNNLSHTERIQFKLRMEEIKSVREAEEIAKRKVARDKAHYIWENLSPASDTHPYLVRKKVRNHGLRINKGVLVIPMRDNVGQLHSLQFIDAAGNKRFLSGGRKKGCYFAIGTPLDMLCICEGYATASSIHDATGFAVAAAFDAGNLKSVALALRSKFPKIEITLCADNDADSPVNIGLNKAREAAIAVSASLAIPPITGDFNDLFSGGRHA